MSKYARPVSVGGEIRMYDVVDMANYEPRPTWGQTDDALLDRIFAPNKALWVAAGQWFVQVCGGVLDGAVHSGPDFMAAASYLNPDGSNGEGELPPAE